MNFRNHKKKLIAGSLAILFAALFFAAPLALRPGIELTLRSNGFPKAAVGQVSFMPDGFFIDEILLDPNGFSSIDDIQIAGSWADLIFKTKAEKISVKNIELSGELDDANRLIIAGWNGQFKPASGKENVYNLPFHSFYLNGVTLDLDTRAGALRLQGKATLEKLAGNESSFNAALWSSQKQLTASINIQGRLNDKNEFSGKAEIADGSIDIEPVSLSRLSGWIEFKSGKTGSTSGQIMAGGMKYKDIPFEDVNFVFDSTQDSRAVFKTRVTGRPITIEGDWVTTPEPGLNLSLAANSLNDVATLFSQGGDKEKIDFSNSGPIEIKASVGAEAISGAILPFNFQLAFHDYKTQISADMNYNRVDKKLSALLNPVSLGAKNVASILSLSDVVGLTFDTGTIDLGGGFICDLTKTPLEIAGPLDIKFEKINGSVSDYKFENLSGNLTLASLLPLSTKAKQKISFSKLSAGKDLTGGHSVLTIDPDSITLHEFNAGLAGGKFALQPFNWNMKAAENNISVNLSDVDLATLIGPSSSLKAEGKIGGTIPMKFKNKDIFVLNGMLTSNGPGSFRYAPDKIPESLQGDDARMETVRLALSDYRYESLQIQVDGPLNGNLKTTLKASGKSPVFENRQVNLNLNLEGALAAALKQALQPGALAGKNQQQMDNRK